MVRIKWVLLFLFLFGGSFWLVKEVRARECTGTETDLGILEQCKSDLLRDLQLSAAATRPLEVEIAKLSKRIASLQTAINATLVKQKEAERAIGERSKKVSSQYVVLSVKVREMYKRLRSRPTWVNLISKMSMGEVRRELAYRQDSNDVDRQMIVNLVQEIGGLEEDKKKLEIEKKKLATLQSEIDKQNVFFQGEVKKAKAYQADLGSKIAKITAAMQEIIGSKIDSLNLSASLGGGPLYCVDDRKLDPGFGTGFAFFTSGIPHRVGMSQYGAQMRAKKGQKYEDILRAYYDNISIEKVDENTEILVNGTNDYRQVFSNEKMKVEDYMKHLYEMPGDWELEALKAQAVAGRSYALAVMRDEGKIAPNQTGQEIKKEENSDKWKQAVEQTKGMVIRSNGQIAKAWYASTAGGYTYKSSDVWSRETAWTKRLRDTEGEVNNLGDLLSKAYDRESPCLYTAQGSRKEYAKSAWLKPEEVADIANVIILIRRDSGIDRTMLCGENSINKKCHDRWSADKVKEELGKVNEKSFDYITEASISSFDFGLGRTNGIRLKARNGKDEFFDGEEFKNFFNLRAPANIVIVGPLYNVERR